MSPLLTFAEFSPQYIRSKATCFVAWKIVLKSTNFSIFKIEIQNLCFKRLRNNEWSNDFYDWGNFSYICRCIGLILRVASILLVASQYTNHRLIEIALSQKFEIWTTSIHCTLALVKLEAQRWKQADAIVIHAIFFWRIARCYDYLL